MKLKLLILLVFVLAACTAPSEDAARALVSDDFVEQTQQNNEDVVEEIEEIVNEPTEMSQISIDKEKSTFEFEGYGPGKSHIGTFDELDGLLYLENGEIIGGEGTIQANSVNTGIGNLDSHLQNDDFFDVALYPEIKVKSTSLNQDVLTADLTFRGITKSVSFPVEITQNSIKSDFVLDTTPFNMKYAGVNKEVRIAFEFLK